MIFNDMSERITFNRKTFFNIIKLIWAVLIIFLWLKLHIQNSWEYTDFPNNIYYDEIVPVENQYNENWLEWVWMHNISASEQEEQIDKYTDLDGENHEYELKYQTLCFSDFNVCMKTQYEWTFSPKDKFMYLASNIYVINTIAQNIQIWLDIDNQLEAMILNSSYWATRWSATRDTVTLNLWAVTSYVEYLWLISHELWHIVDLWIIKWYSSEKDENFTEFGKEVFSIDDPSLTYYALSWNSETVRKPEAVKDDFCSWYWMTDPFEDFAECHNMYMNHNEIFRERAKINDIMKQKYNFFANLYNWKFMFNSSSDLDRFNSTPSRRPWDTTKM